MTRHTLCDFTRTPEAHMQLSEPIYTRVKKERRRNVALHAIGLVVVITLTVVALVAGEPFQRLLVVQLPIM